MGKVLVALPGLRVGSLGGQESCEGTRADVRRNSD